MASEPQDRADDVAIAQTIIAEGRASHVAWAAHLRHCPGCDECKRLGIDWDWEREQAWVDKYDHVARTLARLTLKLRRVEKGRDFWRATADEAAKKAEKAEGQRSREGAETARLPIRHTCILDDGGTPLRTCKACALENAAIELAAAQVHSGFTSEDEDFPGYVEQLRAECSRLRAEVARLQAERDEAREACPIVRRQDFFDASLLTVVQETVRQLFQMQARAEQSETAASHAQRMREEAEAERDALQRDRDEWRRTAPWQRSMAVADPRERDWKARVSQLEAQLAEAQAALRQVLDSHRQPWAYGMDIQIRDSERYALLRQAIETGAKGGSRG